jgi:hypothetical protein
LPVSTRAHARAAEQHRRRVLQKRHRGEDKPDRGPGPRSLTTKLAGRVRFSAAFLYSSSKLRFFAERTRDTNHPSPQRKTTMKANLRDFAIVMTLTALGGGLAQAQDGAGDWKGYPGSNCLPHSGANDVRRLTSGTLSNWQDSATIVHCPVVRDFAAGGDDRIWNGVVRLYDNNASEDGYCRLVVRTLSGALFAYDHAAWTGTGLKTLNFGPLDASNWGNYSLYCSLPAADGPRRSYIRNYAIDERG